MKLNNVLLVLSWILFNASITCIAAQKNVAQKKESEEITETSNCKCDAQKCEFSVELNCKLPVELNQSIKVKGKCKPQTKRFGLIHVTYYPAAQSATIDELRVDKEYRGKNYSNRLAKSMAKLFFNSEIVKTNGIKSIQFDSIPMDNVGEPISQAIQDEYYKKQGAEIVERLPDLNKTVMQLPVDIAKKFLHK